METAHKDTTAQQAGTSQSPLEPPAASWTDHTTISVQLEVLNQGHTSVQVVWLGYDGAEQVYNVVEPGRSSSQGRLCFNRA